MVHHRGRRRPVDARLLRNATRVLREAAEVLDEDDDGADDSPFHHNIESPKELRTPDLFKTHRLDREQEERGLDRPAPCRGCRVVRDAGR